jgi:hypothetical protein
LTADLRSGDHDPMQPLIVRLGALVLALALLVGVGCDRGIESNEDNLTHFAAVTSELRRDARELDLLSKKVSAVREKIQRRRAEISEHVYTDEMGKRREILLSRLPDKFSAPTPNPTSDSADATPTEPAAPSEPSSEGMAAAIALHDQLFGPLRVVDDSLGKDVDYGWWIEELGLASADMSLVGEDAHNEHARAVNDCRTTFDPTSRAAACRAMLENHTTATYFGQVKQQWLGELDTEVARLGLIQAEFEAESRDRLTSADKVIEAYGSSFDGLIIWGFPALIVAVLVIVLFESRRRKAAPEAQTLDTLAVITVLLLVSAIIILGLGGKIQPEALGTLIGGISGYVLGKSAQALVPSAKPKEEAAAAAPPAVEVASGPDRKVEVASEPEPAPARLGPAEAASEPTPEPTPEPAPERVDETISLSGDSDPTLERPASSRT